MIDTEAIHAVSVLRTRVPRWTSVNPDSRKLSRSFLLQPLSPPIARVIGLDPAS